AAAAELALQGGDAAIGLGARLTQRVADVAERATQRERLDVVVGHDLLNGRRQIRIPRADGPEALRVGEAARTVAILRAVRLAIALAVRDIEPALHGIREVERRLGVADVARDRGLQQVARDEHVLAVALAALHEEGYEVGAVELAVLERPRGAVGIES